MWDQDVEWNGREFSVTTISDVFLDLFDVPRYLQMSRSTDRWMGGLLRPKVKSKNYLPD